MRDRVKLLVVTSYFYPDAGGVARHTYNLCKRLVSKYGYEIVVVASAKKYFEEEIAGIKVYRLQYWLKVSNTPINPLWLFQLRKIMIKEKPDVVSAHTPVPFLSDIAAMVCGDTPFVLKYHHAGSMVKGKFLVDLPIRFYELIFLKLMLGKAKVIISSSDFVRLSFLKDYSNRTVTITPGVDTAKFRPKRKNSKNKILFVANLNKAERYKGLEYLLLAVGDIRKKIKDVRLVIVGGGDDINHYKKISQKLEIEKNVDFKGKLIGNQLAREYQQTNVFVLPSLFESYPNVLLEAMATKLPIIGSNTSGISYLIDEGKNGFLFPPKDSKALAKVAIKVLTNPELARKLGENGYEKVKMDFTWDKKVEETKEIIEELLNKK